MSKEFEEEAGVHGWSQKRLRLPHNFEAIIKQCDSSLNVSSIHKLYEQLTAGIYLDNKKKIFWVKKQEDHQYNCFMVLATDLSLDILHFDGFPTRLSTNGNRDPHFQEIKRHGYGFWEWREIEERDGTVIKVAKLMSEMLELYVFGRFDISNLSPGVTYTFSFVILLDDSEWIEELYVETELALPCHESRKQSQKWIDKPRNEWIKVFIGELETHPNVINGVAEFYLNCRWTKRSKFGFSIKGLVIEPEV